jgi:DNA mismatch repair protein MutL
LIITPSPSSPGHPPGDTDIHPLPTEVVHHIAAGEVIDSLGAVVRELVDNALDAEATHIAISLWPEQGQVQVVDNGSGMAYDNLVVAAVPHSTSKIRTQHDLWQVNSLGFRGEALHSLAQAGRLTLASRPAGDAAGWQVTYTPLGTAQDIKPMAMAPGTIVTVTDLFAQWPARRRQLPTLARQLREVQGVIYHSALAHPQVTWTAQLRDRPWLRLTPGATARSLVPQMLKSVGFSDLREGTRIIDGDNGHHGDRIYGLIGLPDRCHRHRPDWVKVAINGRLVTLAELEQGIIQAFRFTLPRHRYPVGFLHLTVNPSHLDWNRSPDKSTLYLHQVESWVHQAQTLISDILGQQDDALPEVGQQRRVTQLIQAAESSGSYRPEAAPVNLSDALPHQNPSSLRAIAQVHDRYILAEQADGLCLIEQHIAHERVLYERLQDQWQVVPLAAPVILDGLSEPQVAQLERLGLAIETFGPHGWAVRSAPAPLSQRPDLGDALGELSRGGDLEAAQVAIACRTALRNGTPLTLDAMQQLIDDWQRTRHPRTCPHGRPICLTLKESSLARYFRRHWVIGKSHGL